MSRSGSEVFVTGVGSTLVGALLSFLVVSLSISSSRNKRRAELVEARRLQGIPEAVVVKDEDKDDGGGDVESGSKIAEPSRRKETSYERRKLILLAKEIPTGEIYDGTYGKREQDGGICYTVFTRKSTVLLHLAWTKVMSACLLVLQIAFLVIQTYRGLYILAFPQYGIASVIAASVAALFSLSQQMHCCLRWVLLFLFLPLVLICDLLDSATLSVEYVCKRDGSPCSDLTAEVALGFFCLRMFSIFITVWLSLLTAFLSFELGCCEDLEVHSYWDASYDSKKMSLSGKDFPRRKGRSLRQAIISRKAELKKQKELADQPNQGAISPFATTLTVGGRGTKKSFLKNRTSSVFNENRSKRNLEISDHDDSLDEPSSIDDHDLDEEAAESEVAEENSINGTDQ
jgi:hypothetical protein